MSWANDGWEHVRRVFRLPPTRRRIRDELDAELRFHLEGRIEDLMDREGLSRADAEREARRRFGDYQAYRQEAKSIDETMFDRRNRMALFDTVGRETRHALRSLVRAPSFSLIVLVTLALGLGAATAIFTLLDRVVVRPLPYPNAERLIHVGTLWPKVKAGEEYAIARGQFFYFKKNSDALANLGLYDTDMLLMPGDDGRPPERVPLVEASASLFDVLSIKPERGRLFTPEEGIPREPTVALITHGYWIRRFGSDPGIVGKRLPFGTRTVEIIGVLPASANVPGFKADVWVPNNLDPSVPPQNNHTHQAIGLMKPGVSVDAAAADIKRLQDQFAKAYPDVYPPGFITAVGFAMHVTSLRESVVGASIVRAFWIIFGAVGVVLLIGAANVANLFLVRIDARRREVAVRAALGAGRSHLAAFYLTESILLSLGAAVCAVALGNGLLHLLLAVAPQSLPRLDEVSFDARGAMFCLSCALLFGIVFGLLPLGSTTVDVATLREGGRGMTTSRRRDLARRGLVITQVALAVVLLSAAALLVRSFVNLRSVRPGFDPVGVQTMTVVLPFSRYGNAQQIEGFLHDAAQRVEALPGVKRAGYADALPLTGAAGCTAIGVDAALNASAQAQQGGKGGCMPQFFVSPGYFEAMGIRVAGRSPTWSDVEGLEGPVVVTEAFARRFWPDENGIGHHVRPYNFNKFPLFPVVGVAADIRANGLQNPPIEAVYLPMMAMSGSPWWNPSSVMTLAVRAPTVDSRTLITAVRQIVGQMDPQVAIANVQSMEVIVSKSMAQTSFTMLLLLISAAIAMILSAVGIYGVIAYIVSQRRAEIGIRMALGAQIAHVASMVVGQSLALAVTGALAGAAAAVVTMRLLQSLLFEVRPSDPLTLAGTCGALILVSILASVGPARRAAKVDPVEAMRS